MVRGRKVGRTVIPKTLSWLKQATRGGSVASQLLSQEENDLVVTILGNRKQWTKFKTGVVCLVKDNSKKSYYIRLLDLTTRSMVFEQEIYNQFTYKKDTPFFHSFPGDKFMVGMNFADRSEAMSFYEAVEPKLDQNKRSTTQRKVEDNQTNNGSFQRQSPEAQGKEEDQQSRYFNPLKFPTPYHSCWLDPSTGNFDMNNISSEWKQLLDKVGVTPTQLKDKKTAEFLYNFVEEHGGIEAANRQLTKGDAPPPPPPSAGHHPPNCTPGPHP
eukprot:Em0009g1096a